MARRLSYQNLILGLALASAAAPLSTAYAQSTPPAPSSKSVSENADPQDNTQRDDKRDEKRDGDGKRDGHGRSDGGRDGGGRGNGGRGRFGVDFFLDALKNPEFLLEVGKRDGGPLELLAPLMKPEVRKLLQLSPEHTAAADKFLADMTKHFQDDITAFKQKPVQPNSELKELFDNRLKTENTSFEEYLKSLPVEQHDRLLGIFVQYRNLRALSNRVVAKKIGLNDEESQKLAKDISDIRRDVFQESGEWARRQIQNGKMVVPSEQENNEYLNKMRTKIDQRIEKLVSKEQLEKLKGLRGPSLSPELVEKLDRPPAPPPTKRD